MVLPLLGMEDGMRTTTASWMPMPRSTSMIGDKSHKYLPHELYVTRLLEGLRGSLHEKELRLVDH